MSKEINHLHREVEDVRNQLTETLQEIADRATPEHLADSVIAVIRKLATKPEIIAIAGLVGTIVFGFTASSALRKRNLKKYLFSATNPIESVDDLAISVLEPS